MGLFDALFGDDNSFVDRLGETLQDTGWFFGGPAVAAFDMAKAVLPGGPSPMDKQAGIVPSFLTGLQRSTQILFGDEGDPNNPNDNEPNLISPGVGKIVDAADYVYKQFITPAVSTPAIIGRRVTADLAGVEDNKSPFDLFGGPNSVWGEADEGRSSIGRQNAYFYFAPFTDRALTDEGQKQLDAHSRLFDIVSGSMDFGSRWFLDPLILAGKGTKAVAYTRTISKIGTPLEVAAKVAEKRGGVLPSFGTRHDNFLSFAMSPSTEGGTRSAAEIRAAVPGLRESADGWVIARAMENTMRTLRRQGVDESEIRDELELITLASYGDADALVAISDRASAAKDMITAASSKYDDLMDAATWARAGSSRGRQRFGQEYTLGEATRRAAETFNVVDEIAAKGRSYFHTSDFLQRTAERIKAADADVSAAEREFARRERLNTLFQNTEDSASIAGTLSNRPLLAGVLTGSTKGMEKRAARERGVPVGIDFVFQSSLWNKAIRIGSVPVIPAPKYLMPHVQFGYRTASTFKQTHAPTVIEVHDPDKPKKLNDFLKATPMAAEKREALVTRLADARDEHTMRAIISTAIVEGQKAMVDDYAARHPLSFSGDAAQTVKDQLTQAMAKERATVGLRQFTAHKNEEGLRGDMVIDDDGMVRYQALLETQLENYFYMPNLRNIEHVLKRHANYLTDMVSWAKGERAPDEGRISELMGRPFKAMADKRPGFDARVARRLDLLNAAPWRAEEIVYQVLDGFNRVWKALVLGTRPLPWAVRVQTDSGLRAMAVLGPTSYIAKSAPRALAFLTAGGLSRGRQAFLYHFRAQRADEELTAQIERLEDIWHAATDEPIANWPRYTSLVAQRDGVRAQIRQYEVGTRASRREAFGVFGEPGIKDIRTAMGDIPGAFGDDAGRAQRRFIESRTSAAVMGDSERSMYSDLSSGNWTYLEYTDPNHMPAWLHAVNAQLKQSILGKQAMKLQHELGDDPERAVQALTRWMRTTPEGKQLQKRLMWTMANKEKHAREVVGFVNHYLPTRELREKAFKEKRITQADLEAALPDPELRPPVHGEATAGAMGRGSAFFESVNRMMNRYMSWVSDATEDQLSRHPMYAGIYEQEAKRRAEYLMADPRIEQITGGDLKRMVQDQAHKAAKAAIKRYMFDIASHSDLSHFYRFMSPFIAAWEDTVRKWGRIVSERPDIIGKAYLAWNAPNAMGLVVDKDGRPVTDRDTPWDETYVLMQFPEWVPGLHGKSVIPIPNAHFRLPKQVVNIVLQGGLQPGFGPLVAYPAGRLQVWQPQLDDVAKIVNPYGPPKSAFDAFAPSTVKRIQERIDSQSIPHRQLFANQYQALVFEARKDPEKYRGVNLEELAAKRTKWLGVLKIMNNFGNPFPLVVDSPFKFYQDAYNVLQAQGADPNLHLPPDWADQQFMQRYGESYMVVVTGLSQNNGGLRPTAEAVDAAQRLKPLIDEYGTDVTGKANPAITRLLVGDEGQGQFNQSAHRWQLTHEVSPGSGVMFRSYDNPQAAVADQDINLGWYQFRKFMSTMDGLANSRGLRTYRDDPQLVDQRQQFIQNLGKENPAWFVDYSITDPTKFQRNLNDLAKAAESDLFSPMRTDMVGIRQYAAMRRALQLKMQAAGVGERSQAAYPFKQEFTDAVMDLVSQNTKFAEWSFYQFLDRDPLLLQPEDVPPTPAGFSSADWGI